jgi:cell division protease FtsH
VGSRYWRNGLVYLLILTAIVLLIWQVMERSSAPERIDITQLAELIREGRVRRILATTENKIEITYRGDGGKEARAIVFKEMGVGLLETLKDLGVTPEELAQIEKLEFVPPPDWLNVLGALGTILPTLLVVGMIWFMFRQAQGTNNQALSFGKSRARMFTGDQPTVTFNDARGRRISQGAGKVHYAGCAHSQGRVAGWRTGNRQDVDGQGGLWRGRRALFQHQRLRVCRNVRRRGRISRP